MSTSKVCTCQHKYSNINHDDRFGASQTHQHPLIILGLLLDFGSLAENSHFRLPGEARLGSCWLPLLSQEAFPFAQKAGTCAWTPRLNHWGEKERGAQGHWMESFFSASFGDPSGASFDAHIAPSRLHFGTLFATFFEGMFETLSKM